MKKLSKFLISIIMSLLVAILIVSCGEEKEKIHPEIKIDQVETTLNQGDECIFTAQKTDIAGDVMLKWCSTNSEVISINEKSGKAIAKKAGNATILVSAGEVSDSLDLIVKDDIIPELTLEKESVTIFVGEKDRVSPVLKYNNQRINNAKFIFETEGKDIINLTEDGGIEALKPGIAEISVKTQYRFHDLEAKYTVNVATTLEAECDLKTPFDFSTLNSNNEIERVVDSEGNEVVDGIITFTQTNASPDGPYKTDVSENIREYIVYYKDGGKNKVNLRVWSLIIKTPQDLMEANKYEVVTSFLSGKARKKSGYFKLANDIDMAGNIFNPENRIGIVDNTVYGGFEGIFDGQGHKITNLKFAEKDDMCLIYALTQKAVVENLSVECTFLKGNKAGVIASCINGGTLKNVTVTIQQVVQAFENLRGGAILGTYQWGGKTSINLENINVIYKGTKTEYLNHFSALGVFAFEADKYKKDNTQIKLSNINIVGFSKISGVNNKSEMLTLDEYKEYSLCENVNIFSTLEEYENSLNK